MTVIDVERNEARGRKKEGKRRAQAERKRGSERESSQMDLTQWKVIMSPAFVYLYTQIGVRKYSFLRTCTCTYSYKQHIIMSSLCVLVMFCVGLHVEGQSFLKHRTTEHRGTRIIPIENTMEG